MKKIVKAIAATLVAGAVCAGAGAFAGCKTKEVPGKSAYEIAVENGFKGTEQEWLDSLKVTEQTTIVDYKVEYGVDENGNKTATFTFTMSDGTTQVKTEVLPASIADLELCVGGSSAHYGNNVIWTKSEIENKNYNLAGINWRVTYDNGYSEYLPVTKDQIIEVVTDQKYAEETHSGSYREDFYRIKVNFNKIWSEIDDFTVLAVENLDTFNSKYTAETEIEQDGYYCRKGETYGINNVYVENEYQNVTFKQHYGEEEPDEYQTTAYRYQTVTAEMLDKAVDTSATGIKFYGVTVGEGASAVKGSVTVVVYDKSVSNVEDMRVESQAIVLTQNDTETTIAKEAAKLVDKTLEVTFYEREDGSYSKKVKITADMIDYSEVNQSVAGVYYVKVNYRGSVAKVLVAVNPDMTGVEVEKTLNGGVGTILSLMETDPVTQIKLYKNGFAELFVDGEEDQKDSLAPQYGYFSYTLEEGTLTLKYNGANFILLTVNENSFTGYDFSKLTPTATYSINFGADTEIKTYENGFATVEMEGTIISGYKLENGIMTFPIMDSMYEFIVGANNELIISRK